jgi:hypothetical protein
MNDRIAVDGSGRTGRDCHRLTDLTELPPGRR